MNRCDVCGGPLTALGYCPNGYPQHTAAEIAAARAIKERDDAERMVRSASGS